jgi:hypothetical protein
VALYILRLSKLCEDVLREHLSKLNAHLIYVILQYQLGRM